MKRLVSEDFGDFIKEELEPEIGDEVNPDDEIMDTSGMPDMEEDEVDIEDRKDKIRIVLRNELLVPEFSRETLLFLMKNGDKFEAVPMAEFPSGNTFVVKYQNSNTKVKIDEIADVELPEEEEDINEDADANGYSFDDYLKDIDALIKSEIPDWEVLLSPEEGNEPELIIWLERNQDLWDLKGKFLQEVPAEDVSHDIVKEILLIEEEDEDEE
jgi:hypothetical protein